MTVTRASLGKERARYLTNLRDSLERAVDHLRNKSEVELVLLFGSYAANRRDLFTDLDLLVVMRSDLNFVERTARLYSELRPTVDLDLLVYTPEEFEENKDHGIINLALKTGQVLYEKKTA